MSSSVLLPALSFADMYFDGEHLLSFLKIGAPDYPEDILRAEMCGHNFGIPGTQLPIRGDAAERERARTLCLLWDILWIWSPDDQAAVWRAFDAFGVNGAEWISPRRATEFASLDAESCRLSAYAQKGRGALFVLANLGREETDCRLTIKRGAIGLAPGVSLRARDEIEGLGLPMDGDAVTVRVKPGKFCMIAIRSAEHTGKEQDSR